MNALFADTSFYVAILNPQDALHAKAKVIAAAHRGIVVTTQFVLTEVGNFFCKGSSRAVFQTMVRNLRAAPNVVIVPATADLFDKAFAYFSSRADKDWSLTDCTSFVVMQENILTEALTADRHFEQAGYVALLK